VAHFKDALSRRFTSSRNALASIWGLASMGSGFGGMMFSLITGWLVSRYSYVPAFFLFGLLPLVAAGILLWVTLRESGVESSRLP